MDRDGEDYYPNMFGVDEEFVQQTSFDNVSQKSSVPDLNIDQSNVARRRTKNFSKEEDMLLVSAYLNTTVDPITGNQQKHDAFWARVHIYFEEYNTAMPQRSQSSIMSRWSVINKDCAKFCGCYTQVESLQRSGATEQDRVQY